MLLIIWRMNNYNQNPEPGTRLEHLAAHVGHFMLYAVLIIMLVTGYLGAKVSYPSSLQLSYSDIYI